MCRPSIAHDIDPTRVAGADFTLKNRLWTEVGPVEGYGLLSMNACLAREVARPVADRRLLSRTAKSDLYSFSALERDFRAEGPK